MGADKRRALVIAAALLVTTLAAVTMGCGGGGGGSTATPSAGASAPVAGSLTLFAYNDGFTPGYINPFRKMYPDLNLKATAYASGDEAIAKLRAGFRADVINLCAEEDAAAAVRLGLVQPIDTSRIKDWGRIFPAFYKLPGVTEPDGKHYMVPVDAGVTGIIYNKDQVNPAPTGFKDLFDPKYKGKVAMIDYAVTAIEIGALVLGYPDPINLTDDQLNNVKNLFIQAKKSGQFRTFSSGSADIVSLFKTGEVVISPGYTDNEFDIRKSGVNSGFAIPSEGQFLWTCGYGISSTCQNVDAAYALLNYYLSTQAESYEAKTWHYMVTNQDTLNVVTPAVRKAATLDFPRNFGNALPAAPPATGYDKWIKAWEEVKRS
jgi:spermidine/putrescine transport system substrate-binding protein